MCEGHHHIAVRKQEAPPRTSRYPNVRSVVGVHASDTPSAVTIEREVKLLAPPDFSLPDLTDVLPGVTAAALTERHLDAIYYDTADLRLARAGITLRHRRGEPGPAWTVKLPEAGRGSALTRREIAFAGPPEGVPDAAADLVLASTRDQPLVPVGHIATVRRPVELRDDGGHLLAEVVDDAVSASATGRPPRPFREVEVEVHTEGRTGQRLLRAATDRLVAAGCVAQPPVPKLVRVLGDRATHPPDVVVASLAADATMADLVRHAIARSVAQLLRHDPGVRLGDDPEDVHQLRVATRRLRSDLRTFGPLLDGDRIGPIRTDLGWLGSQVGTVRDTDVLAARLRANARSLDDVDAAGAETLLRRLDAGARAERADMLTALRGSRYVGVLDTLVALAAAPQVVEKPKLANQATARVAAELVRRPWRRLARTVDALGADPADADLHQVRIVAKRCRYAAEAVAPLIGPRAARFAAAVADVQTVLGDHQDTVVAEAWLRDAAAALPAGRLVAGQLIAIERAQRAELRARWPAVWQEASAKKLRRWL
jgi:CHAD domain-containing protein